MEKRYFIVLILIVAGLPFIFIKFFKYSTILNSPNLIAYYKLPAKLNKLIDLSGHGNYLNPQITSTEGQNSASQTFSCQKNQCSDFNITNALTLGAWVKINTNYSQSYQFPIIFKWQLNEKAFINKENYQFIDTTIFNKKSKGFGGAVFDGRYIYLIPIRNDTGYSGDIARYDTYSPFGSSEGWSFFDSTRLNPYSKGFGGGIFDGRYVYFIPNYRTTNTRSGLVTRYDTLGQFTSPSSWSFFDITTLNQNSKGFWGAVFDGRYIYFVPHHESTMHWYGEITRYDTTGIFNSPGSWSFFNTSKLNRKSKGFVGGVFDGRYIYFIPNRFDDKTLSGLVTRYDTNSDFASPTSWTFFDTTSLNKNSKGFGGGVFDGRYIYFVPLLADKGFNGQVTRYDTTVEFTSSSAWTFFDTSTLNNNSKGFVGGVFDGRYIYFVPFRNAYRDENGIQRRGYHGLILRYDTYNSFLSHSAWDFFDLNTINSNLKGFWGAVYDGRFIFYIPAKVADFSFVGRIVKYDTIGSGHGSFRLLLSQNNQNGAFSASPFGSMFEINTIQGNFSVSANRYLDIDSWHFIVGVYDKKSLKLFIDGELASENKSIPSDLSILKTDHPFTIKTLTADLTADDGNNTRGEINEVFILNRALNNNEIKKIYADSHTKYQPR